MHMANARLDIYPDLTFNEGGDLLVAGVPFFTAEQLAKPGWEALVFGNIERLIEALKARV